MTGILYHRWSRYREADAAYTRALQLNPKDTQTHNYRNTVRKKLKPEVK